MQKLEQIYEGKAKKVFKTDDPELLIVDYKDDATAFNGLKKGTILGKGVINNQMTNRLMAKMEKAGIPTHFVRELSHRETLVKKVSIVPLEVIVRNISAGSFAKRYGVEEGIVFDQPTIEFSYKNDALGDPLLNTYHALALKLATAEEIETIKNYAFAVNEVLKAFWAECGVTLVDFKLEFGRLPDGTIKVLFEGLHRARWTELREEDNCLMAMLCTVPESESRPEEREALVRTVQEALEEYAKNNKKLTQEALMSIMALRDAGPLADAVVPHLKVDYRKKQEVLEIADVTERLERVYELLQGEVALASVEKRIKNRVKVQMERNQREYYLSEQLKAINKEMGREDDPQAEVDELEKKLEGRNMPQEARERCQSELRKLRSMPPSAAEYTVVRNYVDWLLDLPWNDLKEIDIDIEKARAILEEARPAIEDTRWRIRQKREELAHFDYAEDSSAETLSRLGWELQDLRDRLRLQLAQLEGRLLDEVGVSFRRAGKSRGCNSMIRQDVIHTYSLQETLEPCP